MQLQVVTRYGVYGVHDFVSGFQTKRELTMLEWAKQDFDACMNYLFVHNMHEEAEGVFDILSRQKKQ